MQAQTVMTKEVHFVAPENSLAAAYRWMSEHRVRHLPVVSEGRLVGILSDRDVLLHATRGNNGIVVADLPVSEAMTESPITIHGETTVSRAAELMIEYKIDALPVVENKKLKGLVTSSDLLTMLIGDNGSIGARVLPFNFAVKSFNASAAGL